MTHSSSDTAFLTLEKSFNFRGQREHFANSYHFDQVPPDSAAWDALRNQIWFSESIFLDAEVQIERATGHNPGTPPLLVYEYDYPPAGEGGQAGAFVPGATDHKAPGDAAMWVRYGTTQKTVLGKPIYLRNYYHQVYVGADGDTIVAAQVAGLDGLGNQLVVGIPHGGTTYRRAGPRGAVAQSHQSSQFATTRTLKRRGKRKKAAIVTGNAKDVPVLIPGWLGSILDETFPSQGVLEIVWWWLTIWAEAAIFILIIWYVAYRR